jgi:hypothetical protein
LPRAQHHPVNPLAPEAAESRQWARLAARQDGRPLARSRLLRLIPGHPVRLRAFWLTKVERLAAFSEGLPRPTRAVGRLIFAI